MADNQPTEHEETVIKVVTILTLGVILLASVVGITVTAVMTDRDVFRAEALTFGGTVLLGALGGVSWWHLRRRRWHVNIGQNGESE